MVCVDDDDCIANTIFNDASGTCTDGICICDEGFDGIDSWEGRIEIFILYLFRL